MESDVAKEEETETGTETAGESLLGKKGGVRKCEREDIIEFLGLFC